MGSQELSNLQYAILRIIGGNEVRGKDVRDQLKALKMDKSAPAFYQLMARLEDAGLVSGRYDKKLIDGQLIKVRKYEITGNGILAVEQTDRVKSQLMALPGGEVFGHA